MHYLLLFLLFFISSGLSSQTVENINVPSGLNGGSMIGDIINANGKIYTYSAEGILIYDAVTNGFETKIPFEGVNYGKFNPIYFNSRMNVPDQNLMVYTNDPDNKYVYVITPKMQLLIIDADNNNYWFSLLEFPTSEGNKSLSQLFKSQNGRSILRYDNSNQRLYVLFAGRDLTGNANKVGEFHAMMHVFGIFNVDYNVLQNEPPIFNLHYNEINTADDLYGDQINNFIFNETNDYFYLVRLSTSTNTPTSTAIIDIREVAISGITPGVQIAFENTGGAGWFKMGKMLYINDPDPDPTKHIHKILIFPYRYPSGSINTPKYLVIDGNDNTVDGVFACPSKKILDAVYMESNQDLILSYAPDEPEIVGYDTNSSIAIFRWDGTLFAPTQSITSDYSPSVSAFDINASFNLTKKNGSTAIVSRKDGVAQIKCNNEGHYNYSSLLEAESNFFKKGVSEFGKIFLINSASNGLEVFSTEDPISINTGYPVYHICSNHDGSRLLYYNKLSSQNIGLYSHRYFSTTELVTNIYKGNEDNDIKSAIGDVVYNPFQNHFLISKFESDSAKVMAIDADNNNFVSHINLENELPNVQFAKEMFIAPNGLLYIWANMANDPNTNPTVFIYDATDYSYIEQKSLDAFANFDNFIYYLAHTTYNPINELVYSTITCQDMKLLPYNSEVNSLYNTTDDVPPGKLFDIINNNDFDLEFPGKIISPLAEGADNSSQYYGKLFIIGKEFYEYDYLNPPINTSDIQAYSHHFVDITYSAKDDRLFAIKNIQGAPYNPEYRIFEIWTIDVGETGLEFEKFNTDGMQVGGQMASIFSNPYDGKIYVYQKIDEEKLGEVQINLLSFDAENPSWNTTPLGITSYHPEYDHTSDPMRAYFYNITTPYINPYTNHIYLPNGGHSCVSKVSFTPNDELLLTPGINWISIPRHDRTGGSNWTLIEDVFEQSDFTGGYSYLDLDYIYPEPTPAMPYNANWQVPQWSFVPTNNEDVTKTISTRGYKLDLNQASFNTLILSGTVENPTSDINIYEDKENWVGYFLFQSQWPFDAIPANVLEDLTSIKAQGWHCQKRLENHEGEPVYYWQCAVYEGDVLLNYGDMVILSTNADHNFQWQANGNKPLVIDKMETEYYQFNEQPDYTSYFIELDTTENPQEIAAFIGDSCVGATTVLANDTLVLVPGYTAGISGDVVFEEYYGSQKSQKPTINEYFVNNNSTGIIKKRNINTLERDDYYFISFKENNEQTSSTAAEQLFFVYPNPVNNMLVINYSINTSAKVSISICDTYGRQVAMLLSEQKTLGTYTMQWNLTNNNGTKVPKGLYIVKLKINNVVTSKKIVVN